MKLFRKKKKQEEPKFTGTCMMRTYIWDDTQYNGRCYYSTYGGRCHIHGDVSQWLGKASSEWPLIEVFR